MSRNSISRNRRSTPRGSPYSLDDHPTVPVKLTKMELGKEKYVKWCGTKMTSRWVMRQKEIMQCLLEEEEDRCVWVKSNGGERCDSKYPIGNPNKLCRMHCKMSIENFGYRIPVICRSCSQNTCLNEKVVCTKCKGTDGADGMTELEIETYEATMNQ